jgi:hypothetical protein
MELFYYNKNITKPIIFILVKILSNEDEIFLEEHTETIFKILIDNNLATESDILIFNLIKEYEEKIINWILPSTKSNLEIVKKIETNTHLVNNIICQTIINSSCSNLLELNMNTESLKITIKECDINLSFLSSLF